MKLSLVIGRFQPLHSGHVDLINKAKEDGDKTLVIIGSSNQLPDFRNPFSYTERLGLLEEYFGDTLDIRPLPDYPSDDEWIQNVTSHALSLEEDPTQITLYCSPKDEKWYRKHFVFTVETVDNINISATKVRDAFYWGCWGYLGNTEHIPDCTRDFLVLHPDRNRLSLEYKVTTESAQQKKEGHPFANPMEPVSFAVILKGTLLLVGRRVGPRGAGQLGLPGGYLQHDETSLTGCMREVKEELKLDLESLITTGKAQCVAQAVEENLGDLGTRTIGINYLFLLNHEEEFDIEADLAETSEFQWLPVSDVLLDKTLLFFNHNTVVKRLLSKLGEKK